MKFSTIYSALLTALALGVTASPVPNEAGLETVDTNVADIHVPRAVETTKTERYNKAVAAAEKADQKLEPGWYAFTIEWDLPAPVEGTTETEKELRKLQEKLGFEHVAVVAGEVVKKKKGKGKNEKIEYDFVGYKMDLTKAEDKVSSKLRSPMLLDSKKPLKENQTMKWAKKTTAAKGSTANMNKIGKAYFDEPEHKKYNVDSNNCATFRDAILKKL